MNLLTFLDNPTVLGLIFIAILMIFGPQKVPDIMDEIRRDLDKFNRF